MLGSWGNYITLAAPPPRAERETMKKILDGVRYDTEKMIEIGHASASCPRNDFQWWEATLYKSPRAERYCIAGEGGPMSRFSQSVGQNSWSGGSDLIPMTRAEALEWAEQHLGPDEIEEAFGDLIEDA